MKELALSDARYKMRAITDITGTVVERYAYAPYGKMVYLNFNGTLKAAQASLIGNTILYTGRRLDTETGLYYFRARYYDSTLGRFIARDPIGYEGSEWSLYEYVKSKPTTYVDPSGMAIMPPPQFQKPGWPFDDLPWNCGSRIYDQEIIKPNKVAGDVSSRVKHCVVNCRISRECFGGVFSAWIAGDWIQDPWFLPPNNSTADPGDREANRVGRQCRNAPKPCEDLCLEAFRQGMLYPPPPSPPTPPTPPPSFPKSRYPCFAPNTIVWSKKGALQIEFVEPGDEILGFDCESGVVRFTKVTRVLKHYGEIYPLNKLLTSSNDSIEVTDGHPLFSGEKWILSHFVVAETFFAGIGGNTVQVVRDFSKPQRLVPLVFNLITESGTYLVGNDGLVASGLVSDNQ